MTEQSETPSAPAEGSKATDLSVVVIGAGYAGVLATNRLLASLNEGELGHVRLTIINPRTEFVERIRLHELAAGSRASVSLPLTDILHREARLVTGTATRIDAQAQTVTIETATGESAESYDWLIYAPGSSAAAPVPGSREHAQLLANFDGAQAAARALAAAGPGTRVVVVGGGFTGVEAAAEVAEHRRDVHVTLLSRGPIVAQMPPAARRSILGAYKRLGVTVLEDAVVERITERAVNLGDGRSVDYDLCLLALSFTAPDLARASGLAVDAGGRLRVDEALRSVTAANIIGAGDAVVTPPAVGSHLRMGCAVALPLGGHAAETVLHLIRGEEPSPISIGLVMQCLSLGRRRGYIQFVRADDTPGPLHLNGRLGAVVKEIICRMVVNSPRRESRKPGAYRAVKGPRDKRDHPGFVADDDSAEKPARITMRGLL
jgi:NADH dehydrogenase